MGSFAVMLNADTDDTGSMANGLKYANELDDKGNEVEVYLDGSATAWPGVLLTKPGHPVNKYFEEVQERGLLKGACGYCAHAFDGVDGCREAGIELLGGSENHGPNVGALVEQGFELIVVG